MLATALTTLNEALFQLERDVEVFRETARRTTSGARARAITAALRAADTLTATAVELLDGAGIEEATGLSAEMLMQLDGGRMGAEARVMTTAAKQLRAMPHLASAFSDGTVSWGQVRSIVSACRRATSDGRAAVDQLIAEHAPAQAGKDPDDLVALVDDAVHQQRLDLAAAREHRRIERSFLSIQGRPDGSGSFYGEADAETTATVVETLDTIAGEPENPNEGGVSRAQQRMEALRVLCEAFLSGDTISSSLHGTSISTRPRPRILVNMELKDLIDPANSEPMKLLWPLTGKPPRLSAVARDMMLCDATVVPIVFDGNKPIAVGDASQIISPKVRAALIARDQGCRFPGCDRPVSWTDAHHLIPGRGNNVEDLALHCGRCHRRIHRYRWKIKLLEDGTMTFTHRGRTYTSPPRDRAPPSALE